MDKEKKESQRIGNKMFLGAVIGFFIGCTMAIILNPPFQGISQTSSDVQGLVYFSWFAAGMIGSIIGIFIGLINFKNLWSRS
jgi:hypothetical protein